MISFVETLPAQSRDVISSARICARRVGGANKSRASRNQAFDFIGMNTSMVISAGSWSRPRHNLSRSGVKSERVLGLDLSHLTPAQEGASSGIGNQNSLIANLKFGFVNHEVKKTSQYSNRYNSENDVEKDSGKEGLKNCAHEQGITNVRENNRRFGSEELNVGHSELSILSGDNND